MAEANAFWITGRAAGEIRSSRLPQPAAGEVLVRTLRTGISRGTESLVFRNRVPKSQYAQMRAPFMEGDFPFPVKYGYCNVGLVEHGPDTLLGRRVFCLYPHQDRYVVPAEACTPIPDAVPTERAVLAAQVETAINATWDARIAVGDRVAVIGLGVIGALVAWLAARIPGVAVTAFDRNPRRASVAEAVGARFKPVESPGGGEPSAREAASHRAADAFDLVFHASASPAGLQFALALAGLEARVVELSWYGETPVPLPLGESFHSGRLQLIGSQVGRIPGDHAARWTCSRRLELAVSLLADPVLDVLLTGSIPFAQLPGAMSTILGDPEVLCHSVDFS
ncbi:MAG: dehydrogenase [Spirochaetaceae bacterium]|nr:MAG: dehydrogenase [Spirochaetaceae bacterium]